MILWRLDAMHEQEVDGAFCLFFRSKADALIKETILADNGWMTDVYGVDLGTLDSWAIGRLVHNVWPLATSQLLLELVSAKRPPAFRRRAEPEAVACIQLDERTRNA